MIGQIASTCLCVAGQAFGNFVAMPRFSIRQLNNTPDRKDAVDAATASVTPPALAALNGLRTYLNDQILGQESLV